MQSAKTPTFINPAMPALELPGVLSETTSSAYAKTLGVDQPGAESLVIQVAQVQSKAANLWSGFNQLRTSRNPKDTPAAHLSKLEKANKQLQEKLFKESDNVRERLRLREQEIENEIEASFMQTSNDAAEVREVLRNMKNVEDRTNAVMESINSGDASVLAAVISGKPVTTGIEAKYVKTLREFGAKKLAADLIAKKQQIRKASALLLDVIDSTLTTSDKAIGTPEARALFEKQATEADNAVLSFSKLLESNNE